MIELTEQEKEYYKESDTDGRLVVMNRIICKILEENNFIPIEFEKGVFYLSKEIIGNYYIQKNDASIYFDYRRPLDYDAKTVLNRFASKMFEIGQMDKAKLVKEKLNDLLEL